MLRSSYGVRGRLLAAQEKKYTAEASLLFRDPGDRQEPLSVAARADNQDPQRAGSHEPELVSLPDVADTHRAATWADLTGSQIESRIAVKSEGQSDVVSIDATDEDPAIAAILANAFASEFIASRREADQAVIRRAQHVVRNRLNDVSAPDRRTLQSRADDLKILAALQTGKAELVQQATVPSRPSSPKTVRNGVLGGMLGLLLGVGVRLPLRPARPPSQGSLGARGDLPAAGAGQRPRKQGT